MIWQNWLLEHAIESASLLVSIIGFFFAGKYLYKISVKQEVNITNSPNSEVHINVDKPSDFSSNLKKTQFLSDKPITIDHKASKLMEKIETKLENDDKVSVIGEMCLRLAKDLNMKKDIEWLEKELNDLKETKQPTKGLELENISDVDYKDYRIVSASLNLKFGTSFPESFPLKLVINQPIREIEIYDEQNVGKGQIIIHTFPLKMMVETLKVDPNTTIPYVINSSEFQKILSGFRHELSRFIERAKKLIK